MPSGESPRCSRFDLHSLVWGSLCGYQTPVSPSQLHGDRGTIRQHQVQSSSPVKAAISSNASLQVGFLCLQNCFFLISLCAQAQHRDWSEENEDNVWECVKLTREDLSIIDPSAAHP